MYKRITHTIVEEHFDHPIGVEIANGMVKHRLAQPTMANIMPADEFKAYVEDFYLDLERKMLNLVDASFNPSLNFQTAIGDAMDFEALGNTLGNYYDVEFKERFNQALGNTIMQLVYIWRNQVRRIDNTDALSRFEQGTWGYSMLLNQYNNKWDKDIIRTLLDNWANALLDLGNAKYEKNSTAEVTAKEKFASAGSALSAYVSAGLINQFPSLFTM
jgi:hypothetical protein